MAALPPTVHSIDSVVDSILARGGRSVRVCAPLGLGKPNLLLNALYRRFLDDPTRQLTLATALSLAVPSPKSDLERRFMQPFVERHFGKNYPALEYVTDLQRGRLPANVTIREFYLASGSMLGAERAQRDYVSINYTHVARDVAAEGEVHAIVQLVARRRDDQGDRYSLSCNPDVTLDLLDQLAARGRPAPLWIAVVHDELPFLSGDAELDGTRFDAILETSAAEQPLFALPREPVDLAEHAIGLHASQLVKDGGTLQIGIGALSDALVAALLLRHRRNDDYRATLQALGARDSQNDPLILRDGGTAPFATGLYGASEMVMDGFMHLRRAGILKRRVYDDLAVEEALDAGQSVDAHRRATTAAHYLKGAFFLGSKELYAWLRALSGDDYAGLQMCRVSDVNQLYGGRESLDAIQRKDARFFNICMMATALGDAVSDALEDGRVVSGVGGQYNFVAMAHALAGGRSALLFRATRRTDGRLESNIRWSYGHTTIPRHLRDLFVTEYGIADLRGQSDEACIEAMLAICDARFCDELVRTAKAHKKLARDFVVPDAWRRNTPEALAERLRGPVARQLLPPFPFGSDFTPVEERLLPALGWLQKQLKEKSWRALAQAAATGDRGENESSWGEELARLGLDEPKTLRDRLQARLVRAALAHTRS